MATSTRTDTTYSATLLRLHALEEVVKTVQAEMEALWDELAGLEPGGPGGSGDQDRIFEITVGGAQSPLSGDPQAPSRHDDYSLHRGIYGDSQDVKDLLIGPDSKRALINLIVDPEMAVLRPTFYTQQTIHRSVFGDLYDNIVPEDISGYSLANLTYGTASYAIDDMIYAGSSLFSITVGSGWTSLIDDSDSLYSRIEDLRSRMSVVESHLGI